MEAENQLQEIRIEAYGPCVQEAIQSLANTRNTNLAIKIFLVLVDFEGHRLTLDEIYRILKTEDRASIHSSLNYLQKFFESHSSINFTFKGSQKRRTYKITIADPEYTDQFGSELRELTDEKLEKAIQVIRRQYEDFEVKNETPYEVNQLLRASEWFWATNPNKRLTITTLGEAKKRGNFAVRSGHLMEKGGFTKIVARNTKRDSLKNLAKLGYTTIPIKNTGFYLIAADDTWRLTQLRREGESTKLWTGQVEPVSTKEIEKRAASIDSNELTRMEVEDVVLEIAHCHVDQAWTSITGLQEVLGLSESYYGKIKRLTEHSRSDEFIDKHGFSILRTLDRKLLVKQFKTT